MPNHTTEFLADEVRWIAAVFAGQPPMRTQITYARRTVFGLLTRWTCAGRVPQRQRGAGRPAR